MADMGSFTFPVSCSPYRVPMDPTSLIASTSRNTPPALIKSNTADFIGDKHDIRF